MWRCTVEIVGEEEVGDVVLTRDQEDVCSINEIASYTNITSKESKLE